MIPAQLLIIQGGEVADSPPVESNVSRSVQRRRGRHVVVHRAVPIRQSVAWPELYALNEGRPQADGGV